MDPPHELISDVLLWTPTHGCARVGRPARTYIQQLCEDTGCNPEDLPEAMNDREKWRETVRDIRAGGATWWWWWLRKTFKNCLSPRVEELKSEVNKCVRIWTKESACIHMHLYPSVCICTVVFISLWLWVYNNYSLPLKVEVSLQPIMISLSILLRTKLAQLDLT